MHSRDMEYIVGLLKNGKDAEAILSVRRKLNMAFLARTTDLSGKLPVLAFGSTFKKNGDGIQLRRYNGYVLLEVNGLESHAPLVAFLASSAMAAAMPSASCLMLPTMLPAAISSLAASVASTPNTGMALSALAL